MLAEISDASHVNSVSYHIVIKAHRKVFSASIKLQGGHNRQDTNICHGTMKGLPVVLSCYTSSLETAVWTLSV